MLTGKKTLYAFGDSFTYGHGFPDCLTSITGPSIFPYPNILAKKYGYDLKNCSAQRNLSEEGKKTASLIGEVFKAYKIPIGAVLSSPFCRCMDTAKIAFDQAHASEHLFFAASLSKEERAERSEMLVTLLTTPPRQKNNIVLVSHNSNLKEAVNIWPKTEGVIHVFLPKGNKVFEHLGVIEPIHFSELLQAATQVN